MYKLLGFVLVLGYLSIIPANAEVPTKKQQCTNISKMAEVTMALRQREAPISMPLETSQQFSDDGTSSGIETTAYLDNVIMDAYSQELQYSERMKQISINEFAAKYYLDCMNTTD